MAFPKLPNSNLSYRCPEYEVLNIHILTLCTIWNYFCNLKNVKNSYGGLLLLVECRLQPSTLLKVTLLHGCFSGSLNCRNGTKLCKVSDYSGRFFYGTIWGLGLVNLYWKLNHKRKISLKLKKWYQPTNIVTMTWIFWLFHRSSWVKRILADRKPQFSHLHGNKMWWQLVL